MTQSSKRTLVKASLIIMIATLLSRVLGLVRMQVINFHFSQEILDAFWSAYKIPNTLRELLAEGALSVAFIPVFSAFLVRKGSSEASLLASRVLNILVLVVLVVVGLGIALAPLYMPLYVSGFSSSETINSAIELGQLMMPFLLLASIGAVVMGVLNGYQHFAAPAFAPIMFSVGVIGSIWVFGAGDFRVLAWGVLIGGFLQLLVQLPFLRGRGFRYRASLSFKDEGVKEVLRLMLPAALALGVIQLNQLFVPFFASWKAGGVSALQNAILLVQMPQGVFAIAISTALLPGLSRLASLGDMDGFRRQMTNGLSLVTLFMIPSAMFFIFFRFEIVDAIFNLGGKFDAQAVEATAQGLFWYSFGLLGMGGTVLANRFFYGLRNTKTPLLVALSAVGVNIACNLVFHFSKADTSLIALANTIAVSFNLVILLVIINRQTRGLEWERIIREAFKIIMAGCFMVLVVALVSSVLGVQPFGERSVSFSLLKLGILVLVGGLGFVLAALILKVSEIRELLALVGARFKSRRGGRG